MKSYTRVASLHARASAGLKYYAVRQALRFRPAPIILGPEKTPDLLICQAGSNRNKVPDGIVAGCRIRKNYALNAIEASAPYLLPFVRYSLLVPCRKSELVNLPREAYNAFTNTVYVPKSKAGIPIHKPVPDEMKKYFQGIPAGCPWLFYRQDGEGDFHPLGDPRKAFKSCLKAAGLENVRIHDLRHVAASDLCACGNSERAIMDIAGWKTPMLSTYWHKDSLKSAQTIQFSRNLGHFLDTQKVEAI